MRRWLLLAVLAACHHGSHVHEPRAAFQVDAFVVPLGAAASDDLAACKPGLAFVAMKGGVMVAGASRWLIEPTDPPITAVACDEQGDLFTIRGGALVVTGPSHDATVELPAGEWHLVATQEPAVWLWAKLADGRFALLHYDSDNGLGVVHVGPQPIRAVAHVDSNGVAAVLDEDLVIWHGEDAVVVGKVGAHVDGLAVGDDGALYVSGPRGVVRMPNSDEAPQRIVTDIHGPLRMRGDRLYVFWRDGSTILRLTPRAENVTTTTETLPPEKPSIFVEGPASARRESMDFGASYMMMTQSRAMTITDANPVEVASATLGEAMALQGLNFEFNMGPSFSRHFVFAPMSLTLAGASVPLTSVVNTPNHDPGMAPKTADVSYIAIRVPVGLRFGFGYFSLSFGSGLEIGRFTTVAWMDTSKDPFTVSAGNAWIPAWARVEYEWSCSWGLFAQGGRSWSTSSDIPDQTMFGAGLNYRFMRRCN